MSSDTAVIIQGRFRGPPSSGNGGYVCGLLARSIAGPATGVLRAPIPLDTSLSLRASADGVVLSDLEGRLIADARPAGHDDLADPPAAPTLEAARAAGARYVGLSQRVHPICFTCAPDLTPGIGLRIGVGRLEGAPAGHVAGVWTPHAAFADPDGRTAAEVVWAAMDCPGFYAWMELEGRHGALLGTMHAEVIEPPSVGAETIVLAWPIERVGRREIAGVALFDAQGRLLARARQVWIVMAPRASA